MSTIRHWSKPISWEMVCRRASARRQLNAMKTFLADLRRAHLMRLLIELGGLERGAQKELARQLGVHPSVISRDLKRLWPLETSCPTCGTFRPRRWGEQG